MLKRILIILVILILIFSTNVFVVLAATKTELQQQQSEIDEKIKQTENQIDDVQSEISSTQKEIQELNAKISEYQAEIDDLEYQIEDFSVKIQEQEEKLKEAQEQYNHQQEMLEKRLVSLYELGDVTYLDTLLSSDGIVDFISRYYIVTEIAEYDTDLLDQMEKNRTNIALAKQNLEESKNQLELLKTTKESSAQALKDTQATREEHVSQLSDEEKALEEQVAEFEADKRAVQADIANIIKQEQIANGIEYEIGTPSSYGYIYPVPGYTRITTGMYYSWGGLHNAADFGQAGINGQTIVAVKAGTVITSKAVTNSDGSYRSYGEYVVINHHDGSTTLYAHMQPGSRTVSYGDEVVQGQMIGRVGTTGNSTGPHLHFEVSINGRRVNPALYLP